MSRGLGDVYKRQDMNRHTDAIIAIYILMIFFIHIAPFIEYSNIEYSKDDGECGGKVMHSVA